MSSRASSFLKIQQISLLVCVNSARGILVPFDREYELTVTGQLSDHGDKLRAEPVPHLNGIADFGTELMWQMSRTAFQAFRSKRAKVKVSVVATPKDGGEDVHLGHVMLDLREVAVTPENCTHDFHNSVAKWIRLIGAPAMPGRGVIPQIEISFILETPADVEDDARTEVTEDIPTDGKTSTRAPDFETHPHPTNDPETKLEPVHDPDKGYFILLRHEEEIDTANIFYFKFFVANLMNLEKLQPSSAGPDSLGQSYWLAYQIFGTSMESARFSNLSNPDFEMELATFKILSNPESLSEYFSTLKIFRLYLMSSSTVVSVFEFDWNDQFKVDPVRLSRDESIIFEGNLYSEIGSRATDPYISVFFRLSSKFDVVIFDDRQAKMKQVDRQKETDANVDIDVEVDANGRDSNSSQDISNAPLSPKRRKMDQANDTSESSLINSRSSIEPWKKFKFVIDISSIHLDLPLPTQCILRYLYRPFTKEEITTEPSFFVVSNEKGNPKWTPVPRGYVEFTMKAKESVLRGNLKKRDLIIRVYEQSSREFLGTSVINLSEVFSSPVAGNFSGQLIRECRKTVPIICDDKSSKETTDDVIGMIRIKYAVHDFGVIDVPDNKKKLESERQPEVKQSEQPEMGRVIEEMEEWKKNQREIFMKELEELEKQHLNTLGEEWSKREKARVAELEANRKETDRLYKHLKPLAETYTKKVRELSEKESELREKEKELKTMEDKLKKNGDSLTKIAARKQTNKERELQKVIENLKSENAETKKLLADSRRELTTVKKESTNLKSQLGVLRDQKKEKESQVVQLTKDLEALNVKFDKCVTERDALKTAWEKSERDLKEAIIQRDAAIAAQLASARKHEEDYRALLMQKVSHGPSSLPTPPPSVEPPKESGCSPADDQREIVRLQILKLEQQKSLALRSGSYDDKSELIKFFNEKLNEKKRLLKSV